MFPELASLPPEVQQQIQQIESQAHPFRQWRYERGQQIEQPYGKQDSRRACY